MHPLESNTGEKDIDKKPSSGEVVEEAVNYLNSLLAAKMQELIASAEQAKLTPEQTISVALKIQDLALSMCAQVDEVMLKMATESADFSPRILSAEILRMNLADIPEFRIIFSGRKKSLRTKGFNVHKVYELVTVYEGKLSMDVMKIWMLADKRLTQIVELYLRKNLPIGKFLMPEDKALLDRVSKK